jgi:hypothetical protein
MWLEPDDDAVFNLIDHFSRIIEAIVDDTWMHYRIGWRDPKDADSKKKVFVLARDDVKQPVLNRNPRVFFLQSHQLGAKLLAIRDHIIQSLRGFDFTITTPVLRANFPDYLVGEPGSGINELFPPPQRGRPKKRKADSDGDYLPQAKVVRSLRRKTSQQPADHHTNDSSDEKKMVYAVSEIFLEAMDQTSRQIYVFVSWQGWPINASSWNRLSDLTPETRTIWQREKESLFPFVLSREMPVLDIIGSSMKEQRIIPELVDDISSN